MIEPIDRTTETDLARAIDPDELRRHVDALVGLERISGSADERRAADYVMETLDSYGVDATCEEFDGYVSVPERGAVTITHPTRRTIRGITVAFSASTPPPGVHGELVAVDVDDLLDPERHLDLDGAVPLVDSLPNPSLAVAADDRGAAALVCLSPNEHHYEGSVSPVWGTPTIETVDDLPEIPVVQLTAADGEWLAEKSAAGPVELTVRTSVTTELRTLPCPVGRIEGSESDRYFVVGNHIDSWHEGVTDNATAVAATLELARLFADREPKRGLVFGFWPAHSTGRYAGSAWYADERWTDLRENGVAYLHIDLPGLTGANEIWYQHMAELEDEHLDAIREATDFGLQEAADSYLGSVGRPARNSDQSFWGTGLSSLLSGARLDPGTEEGGPIGGGWWWHTPADTLDKVDFDVLHEETKLYVALAARICESPVLPHDYTATVDDLRRSLRERLPPERNVARGDEIEPLLDELDGMIEEANALAERDLTAGDSVDHGFEDLQVRLGNVLVPTLYMDRAEYDQEPKGPIGLLPSIDAGEPDETTQTRRFRDVERRRAYNRLEHRLREARDEVSRFLRRREPGDATSPRH